MGMTATQDLLLARVREVLLTATHDYEAWWLNLYKEAPQHILIETSLILFILWLVFIRKTIDPVKATDEKKFSEKEVKYLIDSWEPEPIVPALNPLQQRIANNFKTVTEVDGKHLKVKGITVKILNLTSYDFLGFFQRKSVSKVCEDTLDKYGCGSCGPRGFYGTIDQHLKTEEAIAKFLGTDESILYSDGASAVSSAIPAFAKKGDILVIDEACCEPILTGALLSRSTVFYFKHNDMASLESILESISRDDKKYRRNALDQRRFIVTEGLFRNTGNICPLTDIFRIKEKYCYRLILDESLSFGVLGATGRGVSEHFGVSVKNIEVLLVAMDTALASVGGLCVGSRDIVDHQRLSGAGYCFSASLPPFLSAAATKALNEIESHPEMLTSLRDNFARLWIGLNTVNGLKVMSVIPTPVIHVCLDLEKYPVSRSQEIEIVDLLSETLLHGGIGVFSSKFSILASHAEKTNSRPSLRICVSASLTKRDIEKVIDRFQAAVNTVLGKK